MSEARMIAEYELDDQEPQGYHIWDDAGAARELEKIRNADEECEKYTAWYLSRIELAKAKRDAIRARSIGYLQDYAESLLMHETKTKRSYKLPNGELIFKKASTRLEHDDTAILKAVKDQGRTEYIKTVTTERLDWTKVKADWQETGEMFDGMEIVDVPETFDIKLEG